MATTFIYELNVYKGGCGGVLSGGVLWLTDVQNSNKSEVERLVECQVN